MIESKNSQMSLIGWATADAAIGGCLLLGLTGVILVALLNDQAVEREQKLRASKGQVDDAQRQVELTKRKLASEQQQREATERLMRQELLGIQGSMDATLFVIDISQSVTMEMASGTERPNWGGDGSPWGFIQNQVKSWVANLPVKHYRIIAFNHTYQEFPMASRWATGSSDAAATAKFLDKLEPSGTTGTEQALHRAALWKPTNIVLITDGAPSGKDGTFDPEQVDRILKYVKSDSFDIPINVVAVNNYFDPKLGTFLHRLSASTGGSFIGL